MARLVKEEKRLTFELPINAECKRVAADKASETIKIVFIEPYGKQFIDARQELMTDSDSKDYITAYMLKCIAAWEGILNENGAPEPITYDNLIRLPGDILPEAVRFFQDSVIGLKESEKKN